MKNKIHSGTGWKMFQDNYYSEHPDDHELWLRLWQYAILIKPDGENLSAILAYLRNCGCQLIKSGDMYVIRPHAMPESDYARERQALNPYKDIVIDVLKRLGKE
jgi:predicted ATPase